jgi:hypothetical protein
MSRDGPKRVIAPFHSVLSSANDPMDILDRSDNVRVGLI